jgi:hypothetical protein
MDKNSQKGGAIDKIASKEVINKNASSLKAYDAYKRAADIIEQADIAAGKRVVFKSSTGSAVNFQIDLHGTYSTTAQEI